MPTPTMGVNNIIHQVELEVKDTMFEYTNEMNDLKMDIAEVKEELDKHNDGAKAQSASPGVGKPPTMLDGQNDEGREMRE